MEVGANAIAAPNIKKSDSLLVVLMQSLLGILIIETELTTGKA